MEMGLIVYARFGSYQGVSQHQPNEYLNQLLQLCTARFGN